MLTIRQLLDPDARVAGAVPVEVPIGALLHLVEQAYEVREHGLGGDDLAGFAQRCGSAHGVPVVELDLGERGQRGDQARGFAEGTGELDRVPQHRASRAEPAIPRWASRPSTVRNRATPGATALTHEFSAAPTAAPTSANRRRSRSR